MSNEPKWVITRDRDEDGNKEYFLTDGHIKYFFEDRVPPYGILSELNRLESENAELRERLNTPRTDADGYWQKRCELAEKFIEESPCDPDITGEQWAAWSEYQQFRNKEGEQNG